MNRGITSALVLVLLVLVVAGCSGTQEPQQKPGAAATYNDGTYTAVSDADHHGYGLATVTISADKITKVDLKEFIETGAEKDFDTYKYEPSVQANQEMAQRIVKANSIHVDDYTKATSSSTKYKQAVARALDKAKTKPAITTEYFDGVFLGKSQADDQGYALALVTMENDQVKEVVLQEVTETGEFKDHSTYPKKEVVAAHEELPAKFVETNGGPVDNVSGATHTTAKWNQAVQNALELAKVR